MSRYYFTRLAMLAILAVAGWGTAQAAEPPLQQHMQRILNHNDQWRTPNPDYDPARGGPSEYALSFHLADDGSHVTGTLAGLFESGKAATYWSLLALYNPVTEKVITQQIGWDGTLLYGEVDLQPGPTQIIDMIHYNANGSLKISRHENQFTDSDTHASVVYERDPDGAWAKQSTWTWQRRALAPATSHAAGTNEQPANADNPLLEHAGYLLTGSGRWRAPNPDYAKGNGEPEFFGMSYVWGPHKRFITGHILSIDDSGQQSKSWTMFITYNPVTQSTHLEQTGKSGIYFRGDLTRAANGRHAQSGFIYFPNGTVKNVRDEVEVKDANTRISHVFERDDDGGWRPVRVWTWRQQP